MNSLTTYKSAFATSGRGTAYSPGGYNVGLVDINPCKHALLAAHDSYEYEYEYESEYSQREH